MSQDEEMSQEDESDQEDEDPAPPPAPPKSLWIGKSVEAQGCDPAECDGICGVCLWEECEVLEEKATSSGCECKVKFPDGTEVDGIPCRKLRVIKASKRKRPNAA